MPIPSTYQEVLKLRVEIANIYNAIGDISTLPLTLEEMADIIEQLANALLKPPEDNDSDVVITPEGTSKVLGLHLNRNAVDKNTIPSEYKHGITFEVKLVDVVNIVNPDFTDACMILTVVNDELLEGETDQSIPMFQIAYSTSSAKQLKRTAISDSVWGTWVEMSGGGGGSSTSDGTNMYRTIVAWSGTVDTIPEGWVICDGTNGTPDLRNRFIIGKSADDTDSTTIHPIGDLFADESTAPVAYELFYIMCINESSGTAGDYILRTEKAAAGGVATLDAAGKVPLSQLPDDIDAAKQFIDSDTEPTDQEVGDYWTTELAAPVEIPTGDILGVNQGGTGVTTISAVKTLFGIPNKATDEDAVEGTDDTTYMTPSKTKAYVTSQGGGNGPTKATEAQALAGTDDKTYMSPFLVKRYVEENTSGSSGGDAILEITNNSDNMDFGTTYITPRADVGVAETGGKVYVIGGTTNIASNTATNKVETINSDNVVSTVDSLQLARRNSAVGKISDGTICVVGGRPLTNAIETYSSSGVRGVGGVAQVIRHSATAVSFSGGIVIAGGILTEETRPAGSTAVTRVVEYINNSLVSTTWPELGPSSSYSRYGIGGVFTSDNRIIFVGGSRYAQYNTSYVQTYTTAGVQSTLASLPNVLSHMGIVADDQGGVFIGGGSIANASGTSPIGTSTTDAVMYYNSSWVLTTLDPLTNKRANIRAVMSGNEILFIGGNGLDVNGVMTTYATIDVYDKTTKAKLTSRVLPYVVSDAGIVYTSDGRTVVAGGMNVDDTTYNAVGDVGVYDNITNVTVPALFGYSRSPGGSVSISMNEQTVPLRKTEKLYIQFGGSTTITNTTVEVNTGVPKGAIIMWSGYIFNIPSGWVLCDGSNGTPDLRDKFVYGATTDADAHSVAGLSAVTLTVSQMPSHGGHVEDTSGITFDDHVGVRAITSIQTESLGGGTSHNNIPPYHKLAYIMKL